MPQVNILNRHPRNWLCAFTVVVVLLPFTLGQSSTGGCGATVTVPAPDPVLGFEDEDEGNEGEGDNVLDVNGDVSIGDDESTTPSTSCDTTYYNEQLGFGFDLPVEAVLEELNNEPAFLFTASWIVKTDDAAVLLSTAVQDIDDSVTLVSYAEGANDLWRENGATILLAQLYTLPNGKLGHVSVIDNGGWSYLYTMYMLQEGIMYRITATVLGVHLTEETDLLSGQVVTSLCVDVGFTGAVFTSEFIPPAPTITIPLGSEIVANDGQFLGIINTNPFDPNSIANQFGQYGNPFDVISIWNPFGIYGSDFAVLGPWNPFSVAPPTIWSGDIFIAYLTTNSVLIPRIHPNDLAEHVGRHQEKR